MKKLVLLRHGQSRWNLENKFTGWTDVELTEKGESEARYAGELLSKEGFKFDKVHTSLLKRAHSTMKICLKEMGLNSIPVTRSWRLNERHYGALQGLNKAEIAKEYGDEQVLIWRRSYSTRPPELDTNNKRHPKFDSKYADVNSSLLPGAECLKDTVERFLPYWVEFIKPEILEGKSILIVAHGNSLRALVKYLDDISDEDIISLNIPTGVPLIYELDDILHPVKRYYLGDKNEILEKSKEVASQGQSI